MTKPSHLFSSAFKVSQSLTQGVHLVSCCSSSMMAGETSSEFSELTSFPHPPTLSGRHLGLICLLGASDGMVYFFFEDFFLI